MTKSLLFTVALIALMFFMGALSHPADMHFVWDGDTFDGPGGALLGLLAAGGGIAIAVVVLVVVAVVLALVFTGAGVAVACAVVLALFAGGLALIPLLAPIAIPLLILYLLLKSSRKPNR